MPTERLIYRTPRRNVRDVDKEDIAEAVAAWLPTLGLPAAPAAGVKDLKGKRIRVAKFTDDATVHFFFPRRTLVFQQRMVKTVSVMLRRRGAKIDSVQLTPENYARFIDSVHLEDSPELRYRFASNPPFF